MAWHCVIAYACQYVCSAWCLTCDLRLCLGRKLYKHLTKMRLSFALAIAMAILALYSWVKVFIVCVPHDSRSCRLSRDCGGA